MNTIKLGDSRYFYIGLAVRKWGATAVINQETIADEVGLPAEMVTAHKALLTDMKPLKALDNIKMRAQIEIDKYAISTRMTGLSLIKAENIPYLIEKLTAIKAEYLENVEDFIATKYEPMIAEYAEKYPKAFSDGKYPSAADLRARFRFEWRMIEMSTENFSSLQTIDPELYKTEMDKFVAEMKEIKEVARETAIKEILKRVEKLSNQATDNKINTNTLKSINSFIERFEKVFRDLLDKDSVTGIMDQVKNILGDAPTADTFKNNEDLRMEVATKMEAVATEIKAIKLVRDIEL